MASTWFTTSANRNATVDAMTSFIHVSTGLRLAGVDDGLWRLTVMKNIAKAANCSAADNGKRNRQSRSVTFATHRRATPAVHKTQLVQPRLTANGISPPIFESE
jgi:hypothetical protein